MTTVMKQRSMEWRQKRLGMVTASRFGDVMTDPKSKVGKQAGEMSKTAESYLHELLAEILTGIPCDRWESRAMTWGSEWEAEAFVLAKEAIESLTGKSVSLPEGESAFILHRDEELIGCSPDGLIGDDALLELKCPYNPRVHLQTVLAAEMPVQHTEQIQGSLWVTGRTWYVFGSYDPRYRDSAIDSLFLTQVARNEQYIENGLAPRVLAFRDTLRKTYADLVHSHNLRNEAPF